MEKWGKHRSQGLATPADGLAAGQWAGGAAGCLAQGWGSSGHAGAAQAEALEGSEGLDGDPRKILQVSKWGKGWKPLLLHDAKGTVLSENPFFCDNYEAERLAFV